MTAWKALGNPVKYSVSVVSITIILYDMRAVNNDERSTANQNFVTCFVQSQKRAHILILCHSSVGSVIFEDPAFLLGLLV